MKSRVTTLCYIEKDDKYLMLHRIYKKNDINKDKWIGIGGHAEEGESPEDCLLREAWEETGLTLTAYQFRGVVTFCCGDYPTEYMCLYTANGFEGELKECDEGRLEWVEKKKVADLNLWDGDLLFFDLMERKESFFSLKLCYDSAGHWEAAVLNGKKLELFDLCDKAGKPDGHVMERGMVHRLGKLHRTVHVWIVQRTAESGIQVLLQKRSANKDAYPGCYDISSAGHVQAGDTFEPSAVRELEEELGILAEASELRFIGYHEGRVEAVFWGERFIDHELSAVYLYEKPIEISALKLQESEVEEVVFMSYEDVLEKIKENTMPNCIFPKEFAMLKDALQTGFTGENVWIKESFKLP